MAHMVWTHIAKPGTLVGLFVIVAATLSFTPGAASGAAESCHGQPGTIVGGPGIEIDGTDGADVIVTNGSEITIAGDGNDLVCVTGGAALDERTNLQVNGGIGDDVIDASANQADRMFGYLGEGDDIYIGGPAGDHVAANDPWAKDPSEGADAVSTGAGADFVETGGLPGRPDQDAVDLGSGGDNLWVQGIVDEANPMLGGTGSDQLQFDRYAVRRALVINNAVGVATDAGAPVMAWDSFEKFRISHIGPYQPPSFVGGEGRDRVRAYIPLTSADMGGGDDVLNVHLHDQLLDRATYDGGDGEDFFVFNAGAGDQAERVKLNLRRGRMLFQPETKYTTEAEAIRARVRGFERHRLSAVRMDVVGTKGSDHIDWLGCKGVIDGRAGSDLIQEFRSADVGCGYLSQDGRQIVRGGRGNDILLGGLAPNIFIGGPGTDYANGGGSNRDRCVAERVKNCEL